MKAFWKKHSAQLLLTLIILVQLGYTTYVFAFEKQGMHSDEIWSYGSANGYDQSSIYMLGDNIVNYNEWTSGKEFHDYITVQDGERFAYDSVWSNLSGDLHPPLYYALVHTICSLFPDQFSWWFAYALSAICLVGTQIFLYLLTVTVTKKPSAGVLTCALYAGGNGALSTFIMMRPYSLMTMLCVVFAYLSALCMERLRTSPGSSGSRNTLKPSLPAGLMISTTVTAFLLFMTETTGVAFAGVFTALFCLWMLVKKYWRPMFVYGGCMLIALASHIAAFPYVLNHLTSRSGIVLNQIDSSAVRTATLFSVPTQIRLLLNDISQYSLGFYVDMFGTAFWRILPPFLLLGCVLAVLLLFPFRHETWFPRLMAWIKGIPARLVRFLKNANYIPAFLVASGLVLLLCVALSIDVYRMGSFSIRYATPCIPFACFIIVALAVSVIGALTRFVQNRLPGCRVNADLLRDGIVAVIVCAMLIRVSVISDSPYLIRHYGNYQDATELLTDKNVLVILSEESDIWMMQCYCSYLQDASKVFFTTADTIEDNLDQIEALGEQIDYCLVTAGTIELTDEEFETVSAWFDSGETTEEATDSEYASIVVDVEEDPDEKQPAECGSVIRGLSNGGDYELLFGMNIQGGLAYMLRL